MYIYICICMYIYKYEYIYIVTLLRTNWRNCDKRGFCLVCRTGSFEHTTQTLRRNLGPKPAWDWSCDTVPMTISPTSMDRELQMVAAASGGWTDTGAMAVTVTGAGGSGRSAGWGCWQQWPPHEFCWKQWLSGEAPMYQVWCFRLPL